MSTKIPLSKIYAHSFGLGDLCIHPSGKYIYTCGSDGEIRVHNETLTRPKTLDYQHTSALYDMALSADGSQMAVCSEDKQIVILDAQEGGAEFGNATIATRFSHAATCAAFAPNGLQLACGSDGSECRILNVHDTSNAMALKGIVAGARWIGYDPKGQYLAVADANGTLRIHDVKGGPSSSTVMLPIMAEVKHSPSSIGAMQQRLGCDWSPDGTWLALPAGNDGEIKVLRRGEWTEAFTLKPISKHPVSLVKFSPSGRYLAAVYPLEGNVHIWDLESKMSAASNQIDPDTPPINMAWSPVGNSLYFFLASGHISRWTDVVPAHLPLPAAASAPNEVEAKSIGSPLRRMVPPETAATANASTERLSVAEVFNRDDDEDEGSRRRGEDDDTGLVRRKGKSSKSSKSSSKAGFSSDDSSDDEGLSSRRKRRGSDSDRDSDDDFGSDDEMTSTKTKGKSAKSEFVSRPTNLLKYLEALPSDATATPVGLQQRPFQSGTTHSNASVKRCYLAWNLIGTVESVNQDDLFNSVTITFADSSRRRITLTDHRGYTMCSLGEHGAVFAAPGSGAPHHVSPVTQNPRSVITYQPFDSWAAGSDWSIELPEDEHAEAVAVGDTWIAVATSMLYVRIFSYSGIQLSILCISGPVVTMTADESRLCIVHHSPAAPRQGQQALELMDVNIEDAIQVRAKAIPVPLSPYASLIWMGFADTNKMLVTCDSQSVFRGFTLSQGDAWVPILDARQNPKGERPWPIAIAEGSVLCLMGKPVAYSAALQHAARSFTAAPPAMYFPIASASEARPAPTKLSLTMPVCFHGPADKALEQVYRARIMDREQAFVTGAPASLKNELMQDAQMLQMIKNHAKDNQARALDLCTRLNHVKSVAKAVDMVNEMRQFPALVERMSVILRARQAEAASSSSLTTPTKATSTTDFSPRQSLLALDKATTNRATAAEEDPFADPLDLGSKRKDATSSQTQSSVKRIAASIK